MDADASASINCARGAGRLIYLLLRVLSPYDVCKPLATESFEFPRDTDAPWSCFICPGQIFCSAGISQVTPRRHPYANNVEKRRKRRCKCVCVCGSKCFEIVVSGWRTPHCTLKAPRRLNYKITSLVILMKTR